MRTEDMILVSVDDHVVEPPDLFQNHLPAKWRDAAPRIKRTDAGTDVWVFEGAEMPNIGLNAVAGKPPHRYGVDPTSFDDIRDGCYDIHSRVSDMDANGVLGSMCFPSFPRFCGQLFAGSNDKDLALALVRAYNDWHIEEWCGTYPDRFIPLALPPLWDPHLMAEEVRRTAAKGCHAVTFSEGPAKLGLPSWHDEYWAPFFTACEEVGTVICLHIGSSSQMVLTSLDAPVAVQISLQGVNIMQAAADLVFSTQIRTYPNLKLALSEGGIGWVPYFLERADLTYEKHGLWTGLDFEGRKPSDVFRQHVMTCFIEDAAGIEMRHLIGVENITWECDYPHSDSTWPASPESVSAQLAGVPDHEVDLMTHLNAMRLFQYDPFSARSRESSTVGALRAGVVDWDREIRDSGPAWVRPTSPLTQEQKLTKLGLMPHAAR